jgi:hypothetical protein
MLYSGSGLGRGYHTHDSSYYLVYYWGIGVWILTQIDKEQVCESTRLKKASLQVSKIEKMQVYKIELQKIMRWNGPSGPP